MEKLKLMWRQFWEDRFEYCDRRFWTIAAEYEATKVGNSKQDRRRCGKLIRKMVGILRAEDLCMKMLGEY